MLVQLSPMGPPEWSKRDSVLQMPKMAGEANSKIRRASKFLRRSQWFPDGLTPPPVQQLNAGRPVPVLGARTAGTATAAKLPDAKLHFPTALFCRSRGCLIVVLTAASCTRQGTRLMQPTERTITKTLFISLPVTELSASTAFYKALGFSQNPQFSGEDGSARVWSEAIQVILVTHAK